MERITLAGVEYIAHSLAQELMTWDEPIPSFSTRFPNILESCINEPFQTFGRDLRPTLEAKAAALFYLMIKNHPFKNGNKRVAVTTLIYFMVKNGRWLKIDNQELYNFARFVAQSPPKSKDGMIGIIEKFVKDYQVPFNKNK